MSAIWYREALLEIGNEVRHRIDNLPHARHAQTGILLSHHIEGRNLDLQAAERALKVPIDIEVAIVVERASEPGSPKGVDVLGEVRLTQPAR